MLSDEVIQNMLILRGEEDSKLWQQGDILRDNSLTAAETKKLAEILQLKPATLNLRRRVSTEVPEDKRRTEYAWSIYAIFIRIEDPIIRWQMMFSRRDWTITEANESVRRLSNTSNFDNSRSGTNKFMYVDDVRISAKLEDGGKLTIKVSLNGSYDVEYSQNERSTIIEFTP